MGNRKIVPYDFNTNRIRYGGRTILERMREVVAPRIAGWRLASRKIEFTGYGSTTEVIKHLGVETHGLIGEATGDVGFYTSYFSNGVTAEDIAKYTPQQIHYRIAELCIEHGVDWDTSDR